MAGTGVRLLLAEGTPFSRLFWKEERRISPLTFVGGGEKDLPAFGGNYPTTIHWEFGSLSLATTLGESVPQFSNDPALIWASRASTAIRKSICGCGGGYQIYENQKQRLF